MSAGSLASKPLRVNAPLPTSCPHLETGRNDEGPWVDNDGMLPKFGNIPTLEFTVRTQLRYSSRLTILRRALIFWSPGRWRFTGMG